MDGDGFFVLLLIFLGLLILFSSWQGATEKNSKKIELQKLKKEVDDWKIDEKIRLKKNNKMIDTALRSMNKEQSEMLKEALKKCPTSDIYFESKFQDIKDSILNPTEEQLKQREEKKIQDEDMARYYSAKSLLEGLKLYPLSEPIDKTGDYGRFIDFKDQIGKKISYKYLYLVRVKSKIDDKKLIKIGITSNQNIEKRFENDDVLELIEVIKSAKLSTKTAIALEYYLIRKYRPSDYFAEKEFDEFSRFDGYTEIIPMKHTTQASEEIDNILKNSENIANAFQLVAK